MPIKYKYLKLVKYIFGNTNMWYDWIIVSNWRNCCFRLFFVFWYVASWYVTNLEYHNFLVATWSSNQVVGGACCHLGSGAEGGETRNGTENTYSQMYMKGKTNTLQQEEIVWPTKRSCSCRVKPVKWQTKQLWETWGTSQYHKCAQLSTRLW